MAEQRSGWKREVGISLLNFLFLIAVLYGLHKFGLVVPLTVFAAMPLIPGAAGVVRYRRESGAWGRPAAFFGLALFAAVTWLAGALSNSYTAVVFGAIGGVWLFVWLELRELREARRARKQNAESATLEPVE